MMRVSVSTQGGLEVGFRGGGEEGRKGGGGGGGGRGEDSGPRAPGGRPAFSPLEI